MLDSIEKMDHQPYKTMVLESTKTTQSEPTRLELIKRQATQAQNFLGYSSVGGSWIPVTCQSPATFSEAKPFGTGLPGYAGCMTAVLDPLPTACTSGSLSFPGTVRTCLAGYSCVTGIVASTSGAELAGDLYFNCNNIPNWAVYRTVSTTATTAVAKTTSATTLVPAVLGSGSSTTHTTPGSPAGTTAPASPVKSGISGAAIAGAVVGPIAGVALILGLVFLLLHKRKNNDTNAPVAAAAAANASPGQIQPNMQAQSPYTSYPPPNQPQGYYAGENKDGFQTNVNDPNRMSMPSMYHNQQGGQPMMGEMQPQHGMYQPPPGSPPQHGMYQPPPGSPPQQGMYQQPGMGAPQQPGMYHQPGAPVSAQSYSPDNLPSAQSPVSNWSPPQGVAELGNPQEVHRPQELP